MGDLVSTPHVNASVKTKEKFIKRLAIEALDSYKQTRNFEGYVRFYCGIRSISEAELEKHRCECHGRTEKSSTRELHSFPPLLNN